VSTVPRLRKVFFAVLGVVVATGVIVLATKGRQPFHQGRSLTDWVHLLFSDDPAEVKAAQAAIQSIGPKAMPYVIGELRQTDSRFTWELRGNLPHWLRWQDAMSRRETALDACLELGPQAKEVIPELERILTEYPLDVLSDDYDERTLTARALGLIGAEALPVLIRAARSPDAWVRACAVAGIGYMDKPERAAIDAVKSSLTDENEKVRFHAAIALAKLGKPSEAWLPTFQEFLAHENEYARWCAIHAVGWLGPRGRPAEPMIRGMLDDPNMATAATEALRRIGNEPAEGRSRSTDDIHFPRQLILR
jgi:HEAT repeat protein